jgi:hypothetical protein
MTYPFWDRKELYDLVWAQPVTKVAKQFGVSDVAIAKACRKLKVPVPGRGYWAKKANGHSVRTKPLGEMKHVPEVSKPQPREPGERFPTNVEDQQEFERIENLLRTGALTPTDEPSSTQQPAIALTRQEARRAKEDWRHLLDLPNGCLDVRVTKGSIDRALEVMSRVFSVCARHEITVHAADQGTSIEYLGEKVRFSLTEKVKQFELPPDARAQYEYGPTYAGKPVDFAPTGLLTLEIHEYSDLRKNFRDTERRKLEDTVGEFVFILMKTAVVLHRRTEDRRRDEREKQERIAAYEKLKSEVRQEKKRVDELFKMAENWKRAETLRKFLVIYRNQLEREQQPIEAGSELEKWLDWAQEQADRVDPLVESPPSILDRAGELVGADGEE